ncbi:hypothetical protein GCM10027423_48760 [Spirosoma arcticum]
MGKPIGLNTPVTIRDERVAEAYKPVREDGDRLTKDEWLNGRGIHRQRKRKTYAAVGPLLNE